MARAAWPVLVVVLAALGVAAAGGRGAHTSLVVWEHPMLPMGGEGYGGDAAPRGAMITETRDVDVGEASIVGVPSTIDPGSVQLRDLGDASASFSEQRFVPGAATPDEILARHLGEAVTVVTPAGELAGVLRAVDASTLVLEVGTGTARHLRALRRDGYVQDVELPAHAGPDRPTLAWRLVAQKPGKHAIEATYRASGIAWDAHYVATFDRAASTIDFAAWADVRNTSGATFDGADLVLVSAAQPPAAPMRFPIAGPVRLGEGETVQVQLVPPRVAAKVRPIVVYDTMSGAGVYSAMPDQTCSVSVWSGGGSGRVDSALELDLPAGMSLPEGRVRAFERDRGHAGVVAEDWLSIAPGSARIRLAPEPEVVGERHVVSCNEDEHGHSLHEKIELRVENRGKAAADVVVRDYLWRWPLWHVDAADESQHGARADQMAREYRFHLPPGAKKVVTYAVVYTW